MAFCKSCGAEVPEGTKFCQACGAPVEEPVVNNDGATQNTSNSASNDKIMAVLAYLGLLVLVPILAGKDSKFVKFHANQGLVLIIAYIILTVACNVIGVMTAAFDIYVIGLALGLVAWAVNICLVVFAIMGIINAANGEEKELPIIGQYKLLK
jgi:uncharacterized membrane protein